MRHVLPISLGVVGLLLMVPGALFLTNTGLSSEDANVALTPLLTIPLDRIGTYGRTRVLIPDTPQWKRIRREWGEPEWIIAAVEPEKEFAYCLPELGLTILVGDHERPLPLQSSYPPYGYSTDCAASTISFNATPGTELNVSILKSSDRPLPSANLIIVGRWLYTKDKLVGIYLDEEVRPILIVTSALGLILVGSAGYVWNRRRGLP